MEHLSVMNKEEKKQMDILISEEKDNLTHEEQLFMDHLLLNNYLVPEQANELEVLEKQYNARKQKKDRIVLTILPTMAMSAGSGWCKLH